MKKINKIKKDLKVIKEIQRARSKNNVYWMNILRLAIKYSPVKAKKLLKRINSQDYKISILVKKLSATDSSLTIIFWHLLFMTPVFFILSLFFWERLWISRKLLW